MIPLKKLYDYFKDMWHTQSKRRIIENSAIMVIIGIVIIIVGGTLFGGNGESTKKPMIEQNSTLQEVGKTISTGEKSELETQLEEILSQIDGAGKVYVMVTFISGKEYIPAIDTKKTENITQEKDNGGGTRSINNNSTESKIIFKEGQGGSKEPVMIKELQPPVKGVVVVADGAAEPTVREGISRAVQVLVDIPIHKIQILERKK